MQGDELGEHGPHRSERLHAWTDHGQTTGGGQVDAHRHVLGQLPLRPAVLLDGG